MAHRTGARDRPQSWSSLLAARFSVALRVCRLVVDVPRLVGAYIRETLDVFEANRPPYGMLFEQVPRFAGLGPTLEIDARAARAVRLALEAGKSRLTLVDLDAASKILARTLRYNTRSIFHEPLAGAARDAFVDELTAMIVGYLFGPRPPLGRRAPGD
jgi:hypothetical protein